MSELDKSSLANIHAIGQPDRIGEFGSNEAYSIYIRGVGITTANDPKPVLGTTGMGPCLGVAIYNPANKTGAVMHFDTRTDVSSLNKVLDRLRDGNELLEVHLAGGQRGEENSERMVKSVLKTLEDSGNITIKSAAILNTSGDLKRIALDTRTGEVYNQFFGRQLDEGPNRIELMTQHARTALDVLPLREEYISDKLQKPKTGFTSSLSDYNLGHDQANNISLTASFQTSANSIKTDDVPTVPSQETSPLPTTPLPTRKA